MAKPLVLLTGATGFVGYVVLVDLLKSGYRVRVAARSQNKINQILAAPSIKHIAPSDDDLSFTMIPDMSASGSYDDAVQGVEYIVHVASPVPDFEAGKEWGEEERSDLVDRTRKGALGILQSAKDKGNGTIRRIIMTSSTVAIVPYDVFLNKAEALVPVYGAESRVSVPSGPFSSDNEAYCASKVASLNVSEEFMRTKKPDFDLISITPSWIFGPDERATNVKELRAGPSNFLILNILMGEKSPYSFAGTAVHVRDVARAHVKALEAAVEGNTSYLVSTPMQWEDITGIAKKHYPEAFEAGRFKEDGKQPSIPLKLDSTKVRIPGVAELVTVKD